MVNVGKKTRGKLLGLFAVLKNEFQLWQPYFEVEAQRAGREWRFRQSAPRHFINAPS